jgi:uncharacterized lipoprotein YmbA
MNSVFRSECTALLALFLAGCAAPPLKLYTLNAPQLIEDARPLPRRAEVIQVDRLILPNDVDSEDILISDGNTVARSPTGRWVSPLSMLATDLVTSRLASSHPDAMVTDEGSPESADYQLMIHVARLDVTRKGLAVMNANWEISSSKSDRHPTRGRIQIRLGGPIATDREVVRLEKSLFVRLAEAIKLPAAPVSLRYSSPRAD